MTCPNCKMTLGCACQKRVTSNGAGACVHCLANYEASLKGLTPPQVGAPQVRVFKAPNSK